ncbi:type I-E CRISPR-associated protein Cas5/CasD [uncultured Corynebacterium sp.]|uniref:type I-E CRISPR-associated protein Cas5/CasD n=1 Tax=uncultured Corynebacterium sp. TaxID=159447 RepID=UPI0025E019F9|nr:type I-E CRISPR-associated protein Cas5/CasD [uncultured Corynebacterium sp.]
MTSSLLLLLKGPMQSWGDESRYATRTTASTPSKSGIVGLIAAAQGRRRTDTIEDLAHLRLAVRVDQSGSLLRDYQTAQPWQRDPKASAKLITRYFLSDAAFVVAVEAEDRSLLEGFAEVLNDPVYPLFMGRRSCPVPPNLVLGIVDKPLVEALQGHQTWHATKNHMKTCGEQVTLPIYRDAQAGEVGVARQDVPVSYNPEHRKYGWREVVQTDYATLINPLEPHELQADPFLEAVLNA